MLAKRLGAKLTPGSGAFDGHKSDMTVDGFRLEAKSTTGASLSLQYEWLVKINDEAYGHSQTPALAITFVNEDGKPRLNGKWVMVPEHVWQELVNGA